MDVDLNAGIVLMYMEVRLQIDTYIHTFIRVNNDMDVNINTDIDVDIDLGSS